MTGSTLRSLKPWAAAAAGFATMSCMVAAHGGNGDAGQQATPAPATTSAAGPAALARAYPDHIARVDGTHVTMRDGTRLPISDGREGKTPAQRLETADIDDMFFDPYPLGRPAGPPARDVDPGRVRNEALFDAMYGDCRRGQVEPRLRNVAWMPRLSGGSTLKVTTVNGVADRLEAVIRDLERLPPEMTRYLVPSAGTYNCRVIAGTNRRSMHSYGAAIDINVSLSDYWLWAGGEGATYRNRIPYEIAAIFEKHGFIWGGKWSHFDTMHFEYRPELLPAG